MSVERTRILVVEDEALVALDLEEQLVRLGYEVAGVVDSCAAAIERAREATPDLVLMDIHLRGEPDGIEAAERLRDEPGVPVVFLTAFADAATLERAKQVSPHGYILKPFDQRDLRATIEIAVHRDRLEREQRRSHENLLALLDVQRAGIVLLDGRGRIQFANVAARSRATKRISPARPGKTRSRSTTEIVAVSPRRSSARDHSARSSPSGWRTPTGASTPSRSRSRTTPATRTDAFSCSTTSRSCTTCAACSTTAARCTTSSA
jgi:AmiR/NasT family two-component response regulator